MQTVVSEMPEEPPEDKHWSISWWALQRLTPQDISRTAVSQAGGGKLTIRGEFQFQTSKEAFDDFLKTQQKQ